MMRGAWGGWALIRGGRGLNKTLTVTSYHVERRSRLMSWCIYRSHKFICYSKHVLMINSIFWYSGKLYIDSVMIPF